VSTMLLTFHGGSTDTSINNAGAFVVTNGEPAPSTAFYALGPARQTDFGALPALRELRGLALHPTDGTLLVANGYKEFSQVLQFSPTADPTLFEFASIYASNQVNHPFDVVFAFNDALYVSSQDAGQGGSPVITYYTGPGAKAGVFPASASFQSLRGLAYDGKYLYAADAGAEKGDGMLYVFAATGETVKSFPLAQPVHVLYDGARYVYIGDEDKDCIYLYDTVAEQAPTTLIGGDTGLDHTAGLALALGQSPSATLLAASRKGNAVLAYPITLGDPPTWNGSYKPFLTGLTDLPEFVLVAP
jgi:hypothetical protein